MKFLLIILIMCSGIVAYNIKDINTNTNTNTNSNNNNTFTQEDSKTLNCLDIKPEEAKKRLESEKGIILLDVRTLEEYSQKHIPSSLLIPVDMIEKEAPLKLTDKNAVIFVYCRSGRRSVTASEALVKMGYSKVYNLGGIIDWPYETESGEN